MLRVSAEKAGSLLQPARCSFSPRWKARGQCDSSQIGSHGSVAAPYYAYDDGCYDGNDDDGGGDVDAHGGRCVGCDASGGGDEYEHDSGGAGVRRRRRRQRLIRRARR